MDKKLAFVLGGGGSRGALQVGALYALLESGLQPDLLVGTSIGALNAAFLARHGFSNDSLDLLKTTWCEATTLDLLPVNYLWLTVRAMFGRSTTDPSHRIRDFIITHGLTPDLCFADFPQPRLVIVSADLNTGKPVLHGDAPEENVLEALLLSTALPPWSLPSKKQGHYLMDGGVVSNLPIEPALKIGATGIVALDLADTREASNGADGLGVLLDRLIYAVEKRQADLELELAEALGIPLLYLSLAARPHVPLWDFQHTEELIAQGYALARRVLEGQPPEHPLLQGRQ